MTYRIALTLAAAMTLAAAEPIPVMLIDGQSGGAYHNWPLVTKILKKQLDEAGIFRTDITTAPKGGEDFSQFQPDFSKYKAVVLNYDGPDWPEDLRKKFEDFVAKGGGLVTVHAADNAFPDWPAFNEMIGIGGWRGRTEKSGPLWYLKDGKVVADPSPGRAGSHGARWPYKVESNQPEHPILKGLPKIWMHAGDELYSTLRGPGKNMNVIASAYSDPANRGTSRHEPVLMALSYGKGRIFHNVMGHDVAALSCVGFAVTLQRGTEWAATGKVTQKVPGNFPTENSVSYRVDHADIDPALKNPPPARR
ncbi:MAG: ThuA domain-containing protein [Acidobacteria bacterium]|nr:ThuA domain-containing protein [Acidobacteriota bacterium]